MGSIARTESSCWFATSSRRLPYYKRRTSLEPSQCKQLTKTLLRNSIVFFMSKYICHIFHKRYYRLMYPIYLPSLFHIYFVIPYRYCTCRPRRWPVLDILLDATDGHFTPLSNNQINSPKAEPGRTFFACAPPPPTGLGGGYIAMHACHRPMVASHIQVSPQDFRHLRRTQPSLQLKEIANCLGRPACASGRMIAPLVELSRKGPEGGP